MFSHVMLGANDIEASKTFYDAILGVVGCKPGVIDPKGRCFYFTKTMRMTVKLKGLLRRRR